MYSWFNELTRIQKPNREKEDYHHYGLYEVEILVPPAISKVPNPTVTASDPLSP